MPLHDWSDDRRWASVHQLWIVELLSWLQQRLPAGYRTYLGSIPGRKFDVGDWETREQRMLKVSDDLIDKPPPDFQTVALLHPEPHAVGVHVYRQGELVAVIELVSPRNKDRPSSREFYRNRYLGYLWSKVHLMLIDVHRRPVGFSFVEAMAAELQCQFPVGLPPHAVSWNAGGITPEGGQFLDGWYRTLTVGEELPTFPLALTAEKSLRIDLEQTYTTAARRAYLE